MTKVISIIQLFILFMIKKAFQLKQDIALKFVTVTFTDKLENLEERTNLASDYRIYKRLELDNDYSISIQGSESAYSEPRIILNDPNGYTHMEVALFHQEEWIVLHDPRWNRYCDAYMPIEECANAVYAYVPVKIIQQMINAMNSNKTHQQYCGEERS